MDTEEEQIDIFGNELNLHDNVQPEQPLDGQTDARTPWRRFFAWSLDTSLFMLLWTVLATLVFRINILDSNQIPQYFDDIIGVLLNMLLEPFSLTWFGTTPGKWIFGLRVMNRSGEKLRLGAAFQRTLAKLWYGTGFGIPIYNLYRLYKSGKACENGELLPWESESQETIRDTRSIRGVGYELAEILVFVMVILVDMQGLLPPNRGALTAEQFAENYNDRMRYFSSDTDIS